MRYFLFLSVLLASAPLLAQQPGRGGAKRPQPPDIGVINDVDVCITDLTEEKLNNPPKREIKFERDPVPLKRKLVRPDPKLIEQKFAVSFSLSTPKNTGGSFVYFYREGGDVFYQQFVHDNYLVAPSSGQGGIDVDVSNRGWLLRLAKFTPKDRLPDEDVLSFLTGEQANQGFINVSSFTEPEPKWYVELLASSPELAQSRAIALLTLIDQGACRAVQVAVFKSREEACAKLRTARIKQAAGKQMAAQINTALAPYEEFTPDMLPNLRVQQMQLDIELAGVKARIAACDRILAKPSGELNKLDGDRRKQVEDLKTTAEIDLSGFTARREKSEEFISKVKKKIELLMQQAVVNSEIAGSTNLIRSLENQIREADRAIKNYAPLPLVDNKITILPLEWTQ
jgi:hypothetical protein